MVFAGTEMINFLHNIWLRALNYTKTLNKIKNWHEWHQKDPRNWHLWDTKNDNSVDREIESMRRVFRRPAFYDSQFVVWCEVTK